MCVLDCTPNRSRCLQKRLAVGSVKSGTKVKVKDGENAYFANVNIPSDVVEHNGDC